MINFVIGAVIAFAVFRGLKAMVKHDGCSSCSSCKGCKNAGQCHAK